ncbi:hypothetical protein NEHOM01_0616 [Nematocida homosporus]|uniref:uncharacterized protein n=1 Tax=Nematocida homosporus TaxID=1912981 RepID=UPI00221F3C9E|nr:uncharacterized protein NEHOM01_0616 [Nematocida homosporus]KAI5185111.1 hypothetical protein NEHOM01_0616 [Nematocida homosporus]
MVAIGTKPIHPIDSDGVIKTIGHKKSVVDPKSMLKHRIKDKFWLGAMVLSIIAVIAGIAFFLVTTNNIDKVDRMTADLTWQKMLFSMVLPVIAAIVMTEVLLGILRVIPLIALHVSYWVVMLTSGGLMFYAAISQKEILAIIGAVIWMVVAVVIYFFLFDYINRIADRVSKAASFLLSNQLSLITYLLCGAAVVGLVVILISIVAAVNNESIGHSAFPTLKKSPYPVFSWVILFINLVMIHFVFFAADVYFSTVVATDISNKATGASRWGIGPALQRVLQTSGTIFIGSIIQSIITTARIFVNLLKHKKLSDNPSMVECVVKILYYILSAFLYIIDVVVGIIHQFVFVSAAVEGTSYTESIKNSTKIDNVEPGCLVAFLSSSIMASVTMLIALPILAIPGGTTLLASNPCGWIVFAAVCTFGAASVAATFLAQSYLHARAKSH